MQRFGIGEMEMKMAKLLWDREDRKRADDNLLRPIEYSVDRLGILHG